MKKQLECLVDEMLDGKIQLREAVEELEKVFIEKALKRNKGHISRTAAMVGVHRNTVTKRVAAYNGSMSRPKTTKKAAGRR